jgi:hypothetical protein
MTNQETYSIMTMPFYNSVDQCYIKVLTLDRIPPDTSPLYTLVRRVQLHKLSPFKQGNACNPLQTCGNVLLKPYVRCEYATLQDIPLLFTWFAKNNFTIDTSITQMIHQSEVRMSEPIVCFITQKN